MYESMEMGMAGGFLGKLTLRRGLACRVLVKEELWEQYLRRKGLKHNWVEKKLRSGKNPGPHE